MERCDRCGKRTNARTMSYFNTEMICMECDSKEQKHADYKRAVERELEQVKNDNYNYEGIGKPEDL